MSLPCSGMMSSWVTQKKSPHRVYSGRTLGQPRGNPIFSGRVASCNNQHTAEHQAPHHQWVGWEGSLPRAWIPARQQQRRSHLRSTGLKRNTRNLCLMHKKIRGLPWQFSGWDSMLPLPGSWVRSLVGDIRSHIPLRKAKNKEKMKKIEDWNFLEKSD